MQDKQLYEYAVLRVVPRVEREEFINVGVVLYCSGRQFLDVVFDDNLTRLNVFNADLDVEQIQSYLRAFRQICEGRKEGGAIGSLPLSSRFRWLTATRSTVLQTSKVHAGFCDDPKQALSHLFNQQVG
ncbi:DUF3037 domain-containing protein [Dyadobacter sp. Leaf189]|uniref:DUF3037 domain-containing protein n=1 Tax=Dyadobacter sp. Leaf189 TaxID=1736295 RepID=UPI0006F88EEE|nr:DUF3037 domain-containing protein [Dyadobacter sp. Leaf189]KQS26992.1 hypothetical protein ASG33_20865 [Dyadobacter sp. Leaf189]